MLPIIADLLGHFGTIMKKSKERKKKNIKVFNISMKCHKLACIKTVLELKNELRIYQAQYIDLDSKTLATLLLWYSLSNKRARWNKQA